MVELLSEAAPIALLIGYGHVASVSLLKFEVYADPHQNGTVVSRWRVAISI